MASTASDLIKFEKQATGENSATWGTKANVALSRIEEAVAGMTTITLAGADYTLDDTQYLENSTTTAESHLAIIKASGTPGATRQIIVPLRTKMYTVWNATTDASDLTVGGSSGTTVTIINGAVATVMCDGTNVVFAGAQHTAGVVDIVAGGTGATTAALAFTALKQAATTSATGVLEIATDAEVVTGTATDRISTPASISAQYSPIARVIQAQTGTTYTLVLGDAGDLVTMSNASANTLTIPPNSSVAFATGTQIDIYNLGAGITSVTGGTGVTLNGVSTGTGALNAQYAAVTIIKVATDTWLMTGGHGAVA